MYNNKFADKASVLALILLPRILGTLIRNKKRKSTGETINVFGSTIQDCSDSFIYLAKVKKRKKYHTVPWINFIFS